MTPTRIVIHCSDSAFGDIWEIDDWHRERGWRRAARRVRGGAPAHVGYHFVICNGYPDSSRLPKIEHADGAIQVGRDEDEEGAHAQGENERALGICLIGKPGRFTPNQVIALRALAACLALRYGIQIQDIIGHCETAFEQSREESERKTCPGIDMQSVRETISHAMAALIANRS